MAIATLELLYDNYDVFTGVVKIRKGTAVQILLGTQTMGDVYAWCALGDWRQRVHRSKKKKGGGGEFYPWWPQGV